MKHIIKMTLIIAIVTFLGNYQLSAQTTKVVKSNNFEIKNSTIDGHGLSSTTGKINTVVNTTIELRKIRVKSIKTYGLVDRNGNPLPTKESVNQIPQ